MAGNELRIVSPDRMRAIRSLLQQQGYTAEAICSRTGISALPEFVALRRGRKAGVTLESGLDVLIRLFLDEEYVSREDLNKLLGSAAAAPFVDAGLLYEEAEQWAASGLLYPVEHLYIASDRNSNPDRSPHQPAEDAVYPAITANTLQLIQLLPRTRCERFLEICAGTGTAALLAASWGAGRAWACDITARSTHYARFNAALNGLDAFTALAGDLYDPVAGRQFDRIVAHPPYVPQQAEKVMIFRDGGADGEQVTAGVIRGAPAHLAPGGVLYLLTYGTDREDSSYAQRIRNWLGPAQDEFDLLLYESVAGSPFEVLPRMPLQSRVPDWRQFVEEHGITGIFYGLVVLQRRAEQRRVFNLRRSDLPLATAETLPALLSLVTRTVQPAFAGELAEASPRAVEGLEIVSTHRITSGELIPTSIEIRSESPVPYSAQAPGWLVRVLQLADGRRTTRELLQMLEEEQMIAADEESFLQAVTAMVQSGFLTVEAAPNGPPATE